MPVYSVRRVLAATSLALTTLTAQVAPAQVRTWDNYCTIGPLSLCFNLSVTLTLIPNPGPLGGLNKLFGNQATIPFVDSVTVRFQNLEGALGSPQPWGLEAIQFDGFKADNPFELSGDDLLGRATLEGNAQLIGPTPPFVTGIWDEIGTPGSGDGFARSHQIGDQGFPIAGCTPLPPDGVSQLFHFEKDYFSTCGVGSDVAYDFFFAPIEFSDDVTWRMTGYAATGASVPTEFSCTLDVTCVQVTPEPSTLALMGTGLIGLAFWLPRRSRAPGSRRHVVSSPDARLTRAQ